MQILRIGIYFPSTNHYPCLQVKGQPTWPLGAEFTIGRGLEAIAALVKVCVPLTMDTEGA